MENNQIEDLIKKILIELDTIRLEIDKAQKKMKKYSSYNCAALHRTRQALLSIEKLGKSFRKQTVEYQRSTKLKK